MPWELRTDEYDALRVAQGYCCKICGRYDESVPLVADHCPDSGRVRGLLCPPCRAMIGQAERRPEVLRAAAAYLEAGGGPEATLRILDARSREAPARTVRFPGSVRLLVDGRLVSLAAGETKTVVAAGVYEIVRD